MSKSTIAVAGSFSAVIIIGMAWFAYRELTGPEGMQMSWSEYRILGKIGVAPTGCSRLEPRDPAFQKILVKLSEKEPVQLPIKCWQCDAWEKDAQEKHTTCLY